MPPTPGGAKPTPRCAMLRISPEEYRRRLRALQADVGQSALDIFVVSALESVYYLSGAGFEPLERPFFLLVRPDRAPTLLVPGLEREHMEKAFTVDRENILTYWESPAPPGRGWPDRLREQISDARRVGVEP